MPAPVMHVRPHDGVPLLVPAEAPPWVFLAFTTRAGGFSVGPFASLNLGRSVGDRPDAVRRNRERLLAATGERWHWVAGTRQVHGREVVVASRAAPWPAERPPEADALVTTEPGVLLWATFADCVPVFLWGEAGGSSGGQGRGVALAHAGWRGTVAGVAAAAARRLAVELGTGPAALSALIGPSIGPCCYEVDEPVLSALEAAFAWCGEVLSPSPRGEPYRHLDLWETNRRVLIDAGLRPENIRIAGLCTACDTERFYSHRASGGRTGRMAGLIGIRPSSA
ncbi:MAG TPA: peptidoglycan editing factor PgeF [Thermaerobacter sp.]